MWTGGRGGGEAVGDVKGWKGAGSGCRRVLRGWKEAIEDVEWWKRAM